MNRHVARSNAVPPVAVRVAGAVRRLGDRAGFWLASSAVFIVNALLSATRGQWPLACLQAATGALAAMAALAAMDTK